MANIHVAKVLGGQIVAGNESAGFFGEVPVDDLFDIKDFFEQTNMSYRNILYQKEPWLKFIIDGKVIFTPKKALCHSVSLGELIDKDLVSGNKTVTDKSGNDFKVRLMRGTRNNPSVDLGEDKDTKYSEWNRLMIPIHQRASIAKNESPNLVEEDIDTTWNINYNNADLVIGPSGNGYGYNRIFIEKVGTDLRKGFIRGVNRGPHEYYGVSYSLDAKSTYTGWYPVLEMISYPETRYIFKKNGELGYYELNRWVALETNEIEATSFLQSHVTNLSTLNAGDRYFDFLMHPKEDFVTMDVNLKDDFFSDIKQIEVKKGGSVNA